MGLNGILATFNYAGEKSADAHVGQDTDRRCNQEYFFHGPCVPEEAVSGAIAGRACAQPGRPSQPGPDWPGPP